MFCAIFYLINALFANVVVLIRIQALLTLCCLTVACLHSHLKQTPNSRTMYWKIICIIYHRHPSVSAALDPAMNNADCG